MTNILAYDIGTTGVKTCLFDVSDEIKMVGHASHGYGLYTFPNGGAEQHADEGWDAMCESTRQLIDETGADPKEIKGISFCSQMQGAVSDRALIIYKSQDTPSRRCCRGGRGVAQSPLHLPLVSQIRQYI